MYWEYFPTHSSWLKITAKEFVNLLGHVFHQRSVLNFIKRKTNDINVVTACSVGCVELKD